MSIKGHREDGQSLVFMLRAGGEMVVEPASSLDRAGRGALAGTCRGRPARGASDLIHSESRSAVDARFDPIIRKMAAEKGVDEALVRAVIQVESGYQPRARSGKGAMGLMQVMPATGRRYGISNLYDPSANIRAGCHAP